MYILYIIQCACKNVAQYRGCCTWYIITCVASGTHIVLGFWDTAIIISILRSLLVFFVRTRPASSTGR